MTTKQELQKANKQIEQANKRIAKENLILKRELIRYEKAYNILMNYWDSLPDEEKPEIDKELKKVGL